MKSKICSSEYVRTVSRGKSWIPAFLSLGFFLAFPVALLLVVGNWKAARYTPDQLHLLYEGLWKEKLVFTGGAITIVAAIMNSINGFSYVYSRKKVDFYHSLPVKRSRMFWNRVYTGLLYCSLYDHGVFCGLYRSGKRIFQSEAYGAGCQTFACSFAFILSVLFQYSPCFLCDGEFSHGSFMPGRYAVIWTGIGNLDVILRIRLFRHLFFKLSIWDF